MNPILVAKAADFARKYWFVFAIIILLILVMTLAYCSGAGGEREKQDQRTIKTQQNVGNANDVAAGARVDNTVRVEHENRSFTMHYRIPRVAMMLAAALAVSSCASRVETSLTFPPVADLKVDREPAYPVAALDPCPADRNTPCAAETAERAWWNSVLAFGRTHRDRVQRICRWATNLKAAIPKGYCDGS